MTVTHFAHRILQRMDSTVYPFANTLLPVLMGPVGLSSSGYPYLEAAHFHTLRDKLPLLFAGGQMVRDTSDALVDVACHDGPSESLENLEASAHVVRTILNTAAVTAPPDLWLLRQLLATWRKCGMLDELLAPGGLDINGGELLASEIQVDLNLLLSRGYVFEENGIYFASKLPGVRQTLLAASHCELSLVRTSPAEWAAFFKAGTLAKDTEARLLAFLNTSPVDRVERTSWCATWNEINLGFRWVPVLLGMRQAGATEPLAAGKPFHRPWMNTELGQALALFTTKVGVLTHFEKQWHPTTLGRRVFARAAGPFGIIQAYRPYMEQHAEILRSGRQSVHVQRGPNVAASQLANRSSFEKANESLDSFCDDTGFAYQVFIEHALGRGEATRQRFTSSGSALTYVGADLEQASIDSALEEQAAGHLPNSMLFLSGADIGQPLLLLDYLEEKKISSRNAVMVVGNGFHEVRGQTDGHVISIFRGYHDAGLILLFTEESALSVENLLETAWNTYHAGFKYVHERSGQGLRPARTGPKPQFGPELPMSWRECASQAGYVSLEKYTSRTRTIFPYAPEDGFNPAISVNHFFIPTPLAKQLKLNP